MMSTTAVDRFLSSARTGPDATPHEAAAHVWARVVATHEIAPDSALAQLGVFDRVVLVLHDAYGLSEQTVSAVLHTAPAAIGTARDAARFRLGLPGMDAEPCDGWDAVRATHPVGDPRILGGLLAHVRTCPTCSRAVTTAEDHRWGKRAAVGAVGGPAMFGASPLLVGSLGAAAVLVTAGVVTGAAIAPMPTAPPTHPVVVDADPGLPSDEEPLQGWPPPDAPAAGEDAGDATSTVDTPADETSGGTADDAPGDTPSDGGVDDTIEGLNDTVGDAVEDTTDAVRDTVDGVGDAVEDLDDTLQDTVDDARDTVDDAVGGLTDGLTDDPADESLLTP